MKCCNISLKVIIFITFCFSATSFAETKPFENFGENPGELTATIYSPKTNSTSAVILLHGCGQNAEWLAEHTGLMSAANTEQFTLLMPQQSKANNMQLCFNWFSQADQLAEQGETASIMNMIAALKRKTEIDKVFLIGLSAGGAMATSLIAQYPNDFSAAGIVAGIGYPCADTLVKALSCMKNGSTYGMDKLAKSVQALHSTSVNWPNITLITGAKDNVVSPKNSDQMLQQWQIIMAAETAVKATMAPEGVTVKRLENRHKNYVELVQIEDMGHGWPVNENSANPGKPAPFILQSPINTTDYLLGQWQL